MKELRLTWEPINKTSLSIIEERIMRYMQNKPGGVSILGNGSLLFTPSGRDNHLDAKNAMEEARFLIDFDVIRMKDGGHLIQFHPNIAVFVSEYEFIAMQSEIQRRIAELKFPEEIFIQEKSEGSDSLMIGLYARGKLQYYAYNFSFYKRLD